MTRAAWERTITDNAGNVLTGVQIAVFQSDGVTPATIYGQLSGGAALANPFNTGLQTSAKFFADPGRYVIRAIKDGLTKEFTDVDIADKAIRDDLGSAAYLTATTSRSDATTGRAMRVGDFGFAGSYIIPPGGDLDRAGPSGIYREETPEHGISFSSTFHMNSEDGRQQLTIARQGNRMAFRGSPFGSFDEPGQSWGPWAEVFHNYNVVGPVFYDFVNGVPTGAIIERGANANGEFTKFADGTMICTFRRAGAITTATYSGAVAGLRIAQFLWPFPSVFAASPSVSGVGADDVAVGWVSGNNVGVDTVNASYFTQTAAPAGTEILLTAIGRWR
jgi:hypothetical protein